MEENLLTRKIPLEKYIVALSFIFIFILIDYSYKTLISSQFAYIGYIYEYSFTRAVLAYLILFIYLLFFLLLPSTGFMFFINSLTLLFFIVPALVLYKDDPEFGFLLLFYNLLFGFLLLMFSNIRLKIKIIGKELNPVYFGIIIILLSLPFFMKYKLHFNIHLNDLKSFFNTSVELRREATHGLNRIELYLYTWLAKVFIPFFIVISVSKKRYILTLLGVLLLVYFYLTITQKSVFFYSIIVLGFALFKNYKKLTLYFVLGYLFVALVGIALRVYHHSIILESLAVRRTIIFPEFANILYFKFYQNHHIYLAYSFINPFIKYKDPLLPPFMIGSYFYGRPNLSVNNGFISQGFADFGHVGVLIYIGIIVLLFIFLNSLKIHPKFSGLIFILFFSIVSSFWTTVLFNHGALWLILMLYFFGTQKEYEVT